MCLYLYKKNVIIYRDIGSKCLLTLITEYFIGSRLVQLTVIETIIMGLLHGLSEFFPLSSSGHLVFFQHVMKLDADKCMFLDILLHISTLIAVIVYFREDVVSIFRELGQMMMRIFANFLVFIKKRSGDNRYTYFKVIDSSYKKLIIMISISTVITAIIGIIGQDMVMLARGSMLFTGICFIITSVILFLTDKHEDGTQVIRNAKYSGSIFVGMIQGVSVLPGLSRTASTITMGIYLGYNNKLAVKYSLLMSIPAILGSTVYRFAKYGGAGFDRGLIPGYFFSMVIAGVVAFFSIKLIMKFIKSKRYIIFAIYSHIVGIAAIIFSIVSSN